MTKPILRPGKGDNIIDLRDDYTVVDVEATGYAPEYDDIIELAALRVRGGAVVDSFTTLVNPGYKIDAFVQSLTGITNDDLKGAPAIKAALSPLIAFIGGDLVVGHNVNFDVNFIYENSVRAYGKPFGNDFVDTMRIARKLLSELKHHRLKDIAGALGVDQMREHRAYDDCVTTFRCFEEMKKRISASGSVADFVKNFVKPHVPGLDLRTITADGADFDETHPLFGKHCVFTGALDKMTRAEAAQLVVNVGGICDNGITKKTNFLILGNTDYSANVKNGKTTKQKKAEEYVLAGIDIQVIAENAFYEMLEE